MVNYSSDGALGLGLLDNFYNTQLKAKNYEFFEDFDDNNKPINEFLITLNEKEKDYKLTLGYDETTSIENDSSFEWIYVPKNL